MAKSDATTDAAAPANGPAKPLFGGKLGVINVGLAGFAEELAAQGVAVTNVAWSPPAGGDAALARLLAKLGT